MKKIILLAVSCLILTFLSCNKEENLLSPEIESGLQFRLDNDGENSKSDLDIGSLNQSEQIKVEVAKLLGSLFVDEPECKNILFEGIIDIEKGTSDELFFLNFLDLQLRDGKTVGEKLSFIAQENSTDFNDLLATISSDYPSLVLDIPEFTMLFLHSAETHEAFLDVYETLDFIAYPHVSVKNSNNSFIGYKGREIVGFDSGKGYVNEFPVFVKFAESNILLNESNELLNGTSLVETYVGSNLTDESKGCLMSIAENVKSDIVLAGRMYSKLNIHEFILVSSQECEKKRPAPPVLLHEEICDNKIDDDGDGLIDENDPDCQFSEICDNEIDDDGDGLVDENDPDCQCNCPRDCRMDANNIVYARFRNASVYSHVTNSQLPGVEKVGNVRLDITQLAPSIPNNYLSHYDIILRPMLRYVCNQELPVQYASDCANTYQQLYYSWFYGRVLSYNPSTSGSNWFTINLYGTDFFVEIGNSTNTYDMAPISYMHNDWDASVFADKVRIDVSEIDNEGISVNEQQSDSKTLNFTFGGSVGVNIGVPNIGIGLSSLLNFVFNSSEVTQATVTTQITADRVTPCGDFIFNYCDDEGPVPQWDDGGFGAIRNIDNNLISFKDDIFEQ